MLKVYIAGKLNAMAVDYLKNVSNMIHTAQRVKDLGFSVFVPCLDLIMGIVAGNYEYEDYSQNNLAWLEVSDCVLVLPGYETSKGTLAEIKRAEEMKIPIYYKLEDLPKGNLNEEGK